MNDIICLDEKFSTTRLLSNKKPICEHETGDRFRSVLALPENKERLGEGGLRAHGYFKHSDKKKH